MTDIIFIYITTPTYMLAESIATHLLEKNLIACANIFSSMKSIYRWQNKIQSDDETAMLVKTQASCYTAVTKEIESIHPYTVPCITAFKVHPNEAFL
jgi:periplasmic divalent cation tolerance protein